MLGTLDHPPAKIMRQLLINLGLGVAPPSPGKAAGSWPVYYAEEPDAPDSVITVYDQAGRDDGFLQTGAKTDKPGVQIRVRAARDQTGWTKVAAIIDTFSGDSGRNRTVSIDSSRYVLKSFTRTSVMTLGKVPSSKRYAFTINGTLALVKL